MSLIQSTETISTRHPVFQWLMAFLLACVDGAGLYIGYAVSHLAGWMVSGAWPGYQFAFSAIVTGLCGWFAIVGHYRPGETFATETAQIWRSIGVALAICTGTGLLLGQHHLLWPVGLALVLSMAVVPPLRWAGKIWLHERGLWRVPTVLVTRNDADRPRLEAAGTSAYAGYDVLERVSLEHLAGQDTGDLPPAQLEHALLERYGRSRDILFILLVDRATGETSAPGALGTLLPAFATHDFQVAFVPHEPAPSFTGLDLRRIDGLNGEAPDRFRRGPQETAADFIRSSNQANRPARAVKRAVDIVLAGILILVLSPLVILIGTLVRRDGGPVITREPRVGQRGRIFQSLKFRTQASDAHGEAPRIGPLLRRTGLHVLPQLVNVLKGEMSLVGPRPVRPEDLPRYGAAEVYYDRVRPGITGLWQISGRNNTSFEERVMLDVTYVLGWSLWRDVVILFKTIAEITWRRTGF